MPQHRGWVTLRNVSRSRPLPQARRLRQRKRIPRCHDGCRRQSVACSMLRHQLLDTSRGRIVTLLQRGGLTADEIATQLSLTPNAVRAQLTGMERDNVVQRTSRRPGTTRPSHVFELTPEVEQLLSQAYVPFLTHLVQLFSNALPAADVDRVMRDVGKAFAKELPIGIPQPDLA